MPDLPSAPYVPTAQPGVYRSTELANAGWYEQGQHGGAVAALIAGHIAAIPTLVPMQETRFTLDLFRVIPIVPLKVEAEVIREGKRIQVIEARVEADGIELCRAKIQRLRLADVGLPADVTEEEPDMTLPASLRTQEMSGWGHGPPDKVMFHRHMVEVKEVSGGYDQPGPGSLWMRVTRPIIEGSPIIALQRLLVLADFCNGVSRPMVEPGWLFMNPDLTVNINRLPSDEWVGLQARSHYSETGQGLATGTLWDEHHYLGQSIQTLFIDRAPQGDSTVTNPTKVG